MAKKIFLLFFTFGVFVFLLWAVKDYLELPTVEFSISQDRAVAVKNAKGEPLPLSPSQKNTRRSMLSRFSHPPRAAWRCRPAFFMVKSALKY